MRVDTNRAGRGGRHATHGYTVFTIIFCAVVTAACLQRMKPPAGSSNPAWKEYSGNPIISMGKVASYLVWNDPSVLKEGDNYRMWLSGGDARNLDRIPVSVYHATSRDGTSWDIGPKACLLASSDPKQWDSLRIETPSVVKVDSTYHLYYSGCDERNAREGIYAIGHATSTDGITWTKDPGNPVITRQMEDRSKWGYWSAVEPGVVYNPKDRTFYLYYVGMRFDEKKRGHVGVLLAKSKDGSKFTHHVNATGERALILTREVENAVPGAWFGYSTPSALISSDGQFHLFCAFLVAPGGPTSAVHVALAHAVSRSGTDFQVTEDKIFEFRKGDWKDQQVRSPTVVEAGGLLEMWFAGETRKPFYGAGIGFARRERP